jgi:hypothetical protein
VVEPPKDNGGSIMSRRITRRTITLLAGGCLLLTLSFAATPQANAATLFACVKTEGGSMRLVGEKTKCHRRSERKVSWNTRGPAGKNGLNGATGKNGANGANGAAGAPGAPGTALGYAKVSAAGTVEPGAKGITSANITKTGVSGYCFGGMSFTPAIAAANVAFTGSSADAFAQVELASANPAFQVDTGCPAGSTAFVFTVEGATAKPQPFYVLFS